MGVHRLAADELASARAPTLRIELHHAGLHRHAARAGANAVPLPAPSVPALQPGRYRSAPATCIKPPAPLTGSTIGVAAGATDGLMHLAHEGLGALANRSWRTRRTPVFCRDGCGSCRRRET